MANPIDLGTLYASIEVRTSKLEQSAKQSVGIFEKMSVDIGRISETLNKKLELQQSQAVASAGRRSAAELSARQRQFDDFAKTAGRSMQVAGAAISVPLGIAINKAAEFDQSMRNTNSLLKLNEAGFQDLKKSVMGVVDDPKIRQGPIDLAKGMYDIASSGFTGQKALDILRQSAYGASAGMTDTATSSRALMAVLNSGIGGVKDAREAMDVLFRAVDRGVFSFSDLANNIGDVLPTAKIMKVNIQEITAAYAVMTKQGLNVAEAQTALNNLLIHVAKPSKEAKELMDELGISYGVTAMEGKGLSGWLQEVIDKTHGNTQAMIKLMPEMRGMKGELLLAGDGLKSYREELAAASTATDGLGATQAALTEQNKGAQAQFEMLKKEIEKLSIDIGNKLLPAFRDVLTHVKSAVERFDDLPDSIKGATVELAAFGAVALTVGGSILTLIVRLKELAALPIAGRLLGIGGGATAVIATGKMIYDMASDPTSPSVQGFGALGGSAGGQGYYALQEKLKKQYILDDIIRSGSGDMAEQRMLRDRVAPAAVGAVRPIKKTPAPIDQDAIDEARNKAKDIATANREAAIEALRLSEDANKKRTAAEMAAADEYKRMINESGVEQVTAFKVYQAKMQEAYKEWHDTVVAAGVKAYEAETEAIEKATKARDDAANAITDPDEFKKQIEANAPAMLADAFRIITEETQRQAFEEFDKTQAFNEVGRQYADHILEGLQAVLDNIPLEDLPPVYDTIDALLKKGVDAIGYAKAGNQVDSMKPVKDKINYTKELLKGLQRDASQVFAGLFEDLLNGSKNPFDSFAKAFKNMLIRMTAELAASKLMEMMNGLVSGRGGKMPWDEKMPGISGGGGGIGGTLGGLIGASAGGPLGGLIGGALGGILGFADGGRPPVGRFSLVGERGPELVKFDRPATVYPNGVMPTGVDSLGGGQHFHGDIHVHGVQNVAELWRQLGEHGRRMDRFRRGSG